MDFKCKKCKTVVENTLQEDVNDRFKGVCFTCKNIMDVIYMTIKSLEIENSYRGHRNIEIDYDSIKITKDCPSKTLNC